MGELKRAVDRNGSNRKIVHTSVGMDGRADDKRCADSSGARMLESYDETNGTGYVERRERGRAQK